MIFALFYIDAVKETKTKQNSIVDQSIEITNLNEDIKDLSNQVQAAKNELDAAKKDVSALKQNKMFYVGKYKITYYCACKKCCGKTNGITASGAKVQEGVTVAADTSKLPFGTKIYIAGIGWRIVQDRGGSIKGNRLDIYISSHNAPMPYNVQQLDVWVVAK